MKAKITLNKTDIYILVSGIVITFISWCYVVFNYNDLPEQIPSHFNGKGIVDNYSSKLSLWVVLIIFTALQYFVFLLAKSTSLHNFQLKNKASNFRVVSILIPFLAIILSIIIYTIIQSAKNNLTNNNLILPFILILTVILLIVMFSLIYKNSKS
ncbi:MAG: DUF1648 domain-containing protein [Flavobacteriaceae bacterium]